MNNFKAIEVHSDIKRTGDFVCGNDKINRLYSNMLWGQKDNYLDIPTDCPQRDGRLGWLGDAQVFARTAAINFDVEKFFAKWLYDLRTEQYSDGCSFAYKSRHIPDVCGMGRCGSYMSFGNVSRIWGHKNF